MNTPTYTTTKTLLFAAMIAALFGPLCVDASAGWEEETMLVSLKAAEQVRPVDEQRQGDKKRSDAPRRLEPIVDSRKQACPSGHLTQFALRSPLTSAALTASCRGVPRPSRGSAHRGRARNHASQQRALLTIEEKPPSSPNKFSAPSIYIPAGNQNSP